MELFNGSKLFRRNIAVLKVTYSHLHIVESLIASLQICSKCNQIDFTLGMGHHGFINIDIKQYSLRILDGTLLLSFLNNNPISTRSLNWLQLNDGKTCIKSG